MIATRKRMATYEIGGKSRRPTLIASQVELQTMQSVSHAAGMRQSICFVVSESPANIGRHSRGSADSSRTAGLMPRQSDCETRFECDEPYFDKFRYPARHRLLGDLFLVDASHFTTAKHHVRRTARAGAQQRRTLQRRARNS